MKKIKIKLITCIFLSCVAFTSTFFKTPFYPKEKEHRFLLMLSSFKRPIFLSGQIYRLLNQTYSNFDISVSIKGSEHSAAFHNTFLREFKTFIDTGRVSVKFNKNRDQYANLLDTVRDVNLDNYDFFCKIDDDDWYSKDYVEEVNRAFNILTQEQQKMSSSAYHQGYILTEDITQTYLRKNSTDLTGPTLCFSREVIKIALAIEQDHFLIKKYIPERSSAHFYAAEDNFLDALARRNGPHIDRNTPYPSVIYGWQYRSIMRNDQYRK